MTIELSRDFIKNSIKDVSSSSDSNIEYNSIEDYRNIFNDEDNLTGEESPSLIMENGALNILHQWDKFSQFIIFCFHDRFHVMLSMNWGILILFVFCMYILFTITLALVLFTITFGNGLECIGSDKFGRIEYFFFTVETMFSIGYGSPRSPTCLITNYFTPIIVISGSILNSITVGIFFTKFSDATSRKWAICFSKELCGVGFEDFNSEDNIEKDYLNNKDNKSGSQDRHMHIRVTEAIDDNCPFTISFRLINISHEAFTCPKLKIFLLIHCNKGLSIAEIKSFNLDVPLEFMETPITVTMFSNESNSPLKDLTLGDIRNQGNLIELMVLLRFFDNRTSKNVEVRKTWKLNNILWGYKFAPIVRKPIHQDGIMYQVGISDVDNIEPVISGTSY